jgi:hypothetical protein
MPAVRAQPSGEPKHVATASYPGDPQPFRVIVLQRTARTLKSAGLTESVDGPHVVEKNILKGK